MAEVTSSMPLLIDRLSPSPFRMGRGVPTFFFPCFFLLDDISGSSAAALCACVSLCSSTCVNHEEVLLGVLTQCYGSIRALPFLHVPCCGR